MVGSGKLHYQVGLICPYATYQLFYSRPHIGHQKCHNYFLVIAPGTLGMLPATSLGQVSKGLGQRHIKNCHGSLMTETERFLWSLFIILFGCHWQTQILKFTTELIIEMNWDKNKLHQSTISD